MVALRKSGWDLARIEGINLPAQFAKNEVDTELGDQCIRATGGGPPVVSRMLA